MGSGGGEKCRKQSNKVRRLTTRLYQVRAATAKQADRNKAQGDTVEMAIGL